MDIALKHYNNYYNVLCVCSMATGLLPAHYGAPRHYSLPSIEPQKPKLVVGHCDRFNLFYVREPSMDRRRQSFAFMR